MVSHSPDDGPSLVFATPEAHFDALRDHPEWTDRRRAEELDLMVRRFPPDRCMSAVRGRLGDLHGGRPMHGPGQRCRRPRLELALGSRHHRLHQLLHRQHVERDHLPRRRDVRG